MARLSNLSSSLPCLDEKPVFSNKPSPASSPRPSYRATSSQPPAREPQRPSYKLSTQQHQQHPHTVDVRPLFSSSPPTLFFDRDDTDSTPPDTRRVRTRAEAATTPAAGVRDCRGASEFDQQQTRLLEAALRESSEVVAQLREEVAELRTNEAYIARLEKEKEFIESELMRNRQSLRDYEARIEELERSLKEALQDNAGRVEANSFRLEQSSEFTFAFDDPVEDETMLLDPSDKERMAAQSVILKVSKTDLDKIMLLTKKNKELERINKANLLRVKEFEDEQLKFDTKLYDKDRRIHACEREKVILFQKLQEVEVQYHSYVEMARHQVEALKAAQKPSASIDTPAKSLPKVEQVQTTEPQLDVTFSQDSTSQPTSERHAHEQQLINQQQEYENFPKEPQIPQQQPQNLVPQDTRSPKSVSPVLSEVPDILAEADQLLAQVRVSRQRSKTRERETQGTFG